MSDLDLIIIQQRLYAIEYYMRIFRIDFFEAFKLENMSFVAPPRMPHPSCRCVIRIETA